MLIPREKEDKESENIVWFYTRKKTGFTEHKFLKFFFKKVEKKLKINNFSAARTHLESDCRHCPSWVRLDMVVLQTHENRD